MIITLLTKRYKKNLRTCPTSWRRNSRHRFGKERLRHCHPIYIEQDCRKFWEDGSSPPLWADQLSDADNHSAVFARWRKCAQSSSTRFLGPTRLTNPNSSSIDSAVFARSMPYSSYIRVTLRRPIFPKVCPFPWESGRPCNTWFVGLTRSNIPNGT